jgi:hypothetical protein
LAEAYLQLDLSGVTDPERVRGLLEGIDGLFGGRLPSFSPLLDPPEVLPSWSPQHYRQLDWSPFSPIDLGPTLETSARLSRKKRKKNDEFATLLRQLSSTRAESETEASLGGKDHNSEIRLVAHMQGEVLLSGNGFDIRLDGGRFSGITREGTELMPARPARSFIRTRKNTWIYNTVSSFSFESDHGTGLREELWIESKEGATISIEYSFRNDSPLLSITLEMRFPEFAAGEEVAEYSALALPMRLLRKGEAATIETSTPDGNTFSVDISEETGARIAPGEKHRISRSDGGWIVLYFGAPSTPSWGLPSFRVIRNRGGCVLEANLFGSYSAQPSHSLSKRHVCYSVHLGIEDP